MILSKAYDFRHKKEFEVMSISEDQIDYKDDGETEFDRFKPQYGYLSRGECIVKHSFNNGESWHTEDEIKEALEAKGESCDNCKFYMGGWCDIAKMDITDLEMSVDLLRCSKHEPK